MNALTALVLAALQAVVPAGARLELRQFRPGAACAATAAEILKPCATVDRAECAENPAESLNLVCTPVFKGADGWDYEPGGQVIFFAGESVPFLKGQIEIQYYEEGKGPF